MTKTNKTIKLTYKQFDKLTYIRPNIFRDKHNRLLEVVQFDYEHKQVIARVLDDQPNINPNPLTEIDFNFL